MNRADHQNDPIIYGLASAITLNSVLIAASVPIGPYYYDLSEYSAMLTTTIAEIPSHHSINLVTIIYGSYRQINVMSVYSQVKN